MIVGTAGHIDHGKTALVRALTGVDTDRLKEEKARGISIDLGFAYLPVPDGGVLGFVDVPGHEGFVHNMLAGATGIDFALLVVAADDGIMPQTREHLAIVDLLGVSRGIVALTKADLASPPRRREVATEIARALAPTGLAGASIVPVSSITGDGVDALRAALFAAAARPRERAAAAGRFRLAVDRCFALAGAGTVVTGTVLSGSVSVGDRVTVSPSGLAARVRAIHAQNRSAPHGRAGERCALNLAGEGVGRDAIARGDVVLDPDLHAPADRIDVTLRVLGSETKALTQWMPVRLHHAAAEVGARIVLLGDDPIPPGADTSVQLALDRPIVAAEGDRFVLRDTSAQRTIGGGRILDLRAPARRRRTPERRTQLAARAAGDSERVFAALLDCPPFHVDIASFARDRAMAPDGLEAVCRRQDVTRIAAGDGVTAVTGARWRAFGAAIAALLAAFHEAYPDLPGIGVEKLRVQPDLRLSGPAFRAALQILAREGAVVLDGSWVRLPGHEVRLSAADEAHWRAMRPLLGGENRFRPPRVRDVAATLALGEPEVRRIMKLLGRIGRLHEVAHDHFFLRETVAEMVEIACDVAAGSEAGEFAAARFRDRVANGRKVAIQILEFFDRHGVTIRRGDLRRMSRHRLDLFHTIDAGDPASENKAFPELLRAG